MWDLILCLYLINATLLIDHEIDSAYWKEWELFKLPGGITGFLIVHVPLILLVLVGLVYVARQESLGLIFSLGLGLAGIVAFFLHLTFILLGKPHFKTRVSLALLSGILVVSVIQAGVSVAGLAGYG
jgi:hypothetical protein